MTAFPMPYFVKRNVLSELGGSAGAKKFLVGAVWGPIIFWGDSAGANIFWGDSAGAKKFGGLGPA